MSGKKFTSLTYKQKLQLIDEASYSTKLELCTKYNCSTSTINRILRNAEEITKKPNCQLTRKRNRGGAYKEVELELLAWYNQKKSKGEIVSTNLLLEKAKDIGAKTNTEFLPSVGWLWRWEKRNGVVIRKTQRKHNSVYNDDWNDTRSSSPLVNYAQVDVFAAGFTGLCYKAPALKTAKTNFIDSAEDRLTILFICNATGDYRKAYVIGAGESPRSLQNRILPLKYFGNCDATLTHEIWYNVLHELDMEMTQTNRKIILYLDKVPLSQQQVEHMKNVRLRFYPTNTTPFAKPPDSGIIQYFRLYYKEAILRREFSKYAKDDTSFNIFQAMQIIKHSLCSIKPLIIKNSFKEAKLITVDSQAEFEYEETEYPENNDEPSESGFEYIKCDDISFDTEDFPSRDINTESSYNGNAFSLQMQHSHPTHREALGYIESLNCYFSTDSKFIKELTEMKAEIVLNLENSCQRKITDFFQPKR